jgi:hypothetical protein
VSCLLLPPSTCRTSWKVRRTPLRAIEYAITGKVDHLSHEYSGRNQEKGLLNTHKPKDATAQVSIAFLDNTSLTISLNSTGRAVRVGEGQKHVDSWSSGRMVLRQDEVAAFVKSSKGEKYSTLLPLLGLSHLETRAVNIHRVKAAVSRQSGLDAAQGALKAATRQMRDAWGDDTQGNAGVAFHTLCTQFVNEPHEHSPKTCGDLIRRELQQRTRDAQGQQRMQDAVAELAGVDVKSAIKALRKSRDELARVAGRSVQLRLRVLRSAEDFMRELADHQSTLECPACGQDIARDAMQTHLAAERTQLQEALSRISKAEEDEASLLAVVRRVVEISQRRELTHWAQGASNPKILERVTAAAEYRMPAAVTSDDLDVIEIVLGDAIVAAASAAFTAAPLQEWLAAQRRCDAANALLDAELAVADAAAAEQIAAILADREGEVRREIAERTQEIIRAISDDVQRMWHILRPDNPIDDIRLRVPESSDKAIDIALRFHGKDLDSPRLTLSEGYRNSLGLCVFLAMALRDGAGAPIVLDDVIVSLDRDHRGMVATLLLEEFPDRQILLFTHDRDWFAELRQQLDAREWTFVRLAPYDGPTSGITAADNRGLLAEARSYVKSSPDTAATLARKAMDMELALVAEGLALKGLVFQRGERNDRRTAHELIEALISEGKQSYKVRSQGALIDNQEAVRKWRSADSLLITWGNKGSHSEDVARVEAEKLVEACEAALASFVCQECGRKVWYSKSPKARQCECGFLQWKG